MGYIFQMKSANFIKKCFVIFFIGVLFHSFYEGKSHSEEGYEYKRRNKAEEQKQYTAKLYQDKKKVELAVKNTKSLIDRSRNRPYLSELYLRLAELYIEKSRIVYFIRKTEHGGKKSSLDQLEANTLKNQAIEIYQRILNHFPEFKDRDKIHFYMAHEYRELGQTDEMIKQYRAIIKQHKKSAYVPEAYLLLGDYFIHKEDLDMAETHYKAVLNYSKSQAVAIARYKLAWCHINKKEFKKAIKLLEEAVVRTAASKKFDIDTYDRVDIKLEALIDMAFCYTESYKKASPEESLAYFRKFAWSRQVYMMVLEKLAYRYLLKKKWHNASVIYRRLSTFQNDAEKLLEYSRNIFECVQILESFDNADRDMAFIVEALRKQRYSIHIPKKEKEKNIKDFELYARNLATHLHQKSRKKKSVSDFKRAADSYKLYLDFFDKSPTRFEMTSNYAEALFSSRQYLEAGKQYERLAKKIYFKNKEKQEKLYSAVISYYNALKRKKNLNYYQVAFARDGLKATGKLYAVDFPRSKHVPDVCFNVAWISYDSGNYDDAIADFTDFVAAYPAGKPAKAAIHLIMDSYYLKEDFKGLIKYGKAVINNSKITDKKLKLEVAKIVQNTESKIVSSVTIAAVNDWEKGKADLEDIAKQGGSSTMNEQAVDALLLSGKEKGDVSAVITACKIILKQYSSSHKTEDTISEMIDASIRSAQFRLLGRYLELFAAKLPKHANTTNFLYQAGNIRKNLGQYALSNRDYRKFLKRSPKNTRMREEIIFAMAENAIHLSKIKTAIKLLIRNRAKLSKSGRLKADAKIADLYLQSRNYNKAYKYRKKAYRNYSSKLAAKDEQLKEVMAKAVFNVVHRSYKKYMTLRLKGHINKRIVTNKAKLLGKLEKGYRAVMRYKSPHWALTACFYANEINREFARFLKKSPLPDLTPEQKVQYVKLINQKADGYSQKANQYLQTCIQQAHKWEICDPRMAGFFNISAESKGQVRQFDSFSKSKSTVKIAGRSLKYPDLKSLHDKLMLKPDDYNTLLALCKLYIKKGDFRHALLVGQKALGEKKGLNNRLKADFYNNIGMSYLCIGDDQRAKDAFKKALSIDAGNIGARINLAGLLRHYGHYKKADRIYAGLPNKSKVKESTDVINPRAQELYHVYVRTKKYG